MHVFFSWCLGWTFIWSLVPPDKGPWALAPTTCSTMTTTWSQTESRWSRTSCVTCTSTGPELSRCLLLASTPTSLPSSLGWPTQDTPTRDLANYSTFCKSLAYQTVALLCFTIFFSLLSVQKFVSLFRNKKTHQANFGCSNEASFASYFQVIS